MSLAVSESALLVSVLVDVLDVGVEVVCVSRLATAPESAEMDSLAAGASALYAAVVEHLYIESLPFRVRYCLLSCSLFIRWMDDVLHIWRNQKLSRDARKALWRMQHKDFYGTSLQLLRDRDAFAAFGFTFRTSGGLIGATSELRFLPERGGRRRG